MVDKKMTIRDVLAMDPGTARIMIASAARTPPPNRSRKPAWCTASTSTRWSIRSISISPRTASKRRIFQPGIARLKKKTRRPLVKTDAVFS